jgi:hypothetical protein
MTQFIPAKNKLEAVVRISSLTNSGPEVLGPGSKERKSVFENLAKGLDLNFSGKETKQALGKKIVERLGGNWAKSCESTGQTITLYGLNLVLRLAEDHFLSTKIQNRYTCNCKSAVQEIAEIKNIAVSVTPKSMDGKKCVLSMQKAGGKWKKTEWHGEYYEMILFAALVNSIGGGKRKFRNTTFDYACLNTWDIKVASVNGSKTNTHYVNDEKATNAAISSGGLGLIILSGDSKRSLAFAMWHKKLRGQNGVPKKKLTEKFIPRKLDLFFIPDQSALKNAISAGALKLQTQGPNSNGKPRPKKYGINLRKARLSGIFMTSHTF